MLKDLVNIKDKVQYVLENYPKTQDNDKLLWLAVMVVNYDLREVLGENAYLNFKSWLLKNDIPTFESVTRIRRKFQEANLYVGTKRNHRLNEEGLVRDWATQGKLNLE